MLSGLLAMVIYPLFVFYVGEISIKDCIYRIRLIIPLILVVGIFNPIFDREVVAYICGVGISGGWLAMITLSIKGLLTVLAVYILIATTKVEDICYSLQLMHVPTIITTVILLVYRYLGLLFNEVEKIIIAYKLRAPNQRGVNYKVWGSLVGQLLLRSMDRANIVYDAMELRGFNGNIKNRGKKLRLDITNVIYLALWLILFYLIRHTDILEILGGLFV